NTAPFARKGIETTQRRIRLPITLALKTSNTAKPISTYHGKNLRASPTRTITRMRSRVQRDMMSPPVSDELVVATAHASGGHRWRGWVATDLVQHNSQQPRYVRSS